MKRQADRGTAQGRREGKAKSGSHVGRSRAAKTCFVLEINHKAVLTFSAATLKSAQGRLQESWFVEELSRLTSGGRPILSPADACAVRLALPREAVEVEVNRCMDKARGDDDEFGFAFLVMVDLQPN